MKTSLIMLKSLLFSLLFISNSGLAHDADKLGFDCQAIAQEYNTTSIQGEKWSQIYSLTEFGGGGCPIKAVGAIVPYPERNWFILFEKGTDRYTYYKADEKAWTRIFRMSQFGKGTCPFNEIGAAYEYHSEGKDKIMLFDAESQNYVAYSGKPEPNCTQPSNFEFDFGGGGAPFAEVGAVVTYPGRNWSIIFEKDSDRYTYYDHGGRVWKGVYKLHQFGRGGCPFNSIGAAMPYTDGAGRKKILLFDSSGENYVYYDDQVNFMASRLKDMDGSVVVIKSHRWEGAYVELSANGGAGVKRIPSSQVFGTDEIRLILHHVEGNIVCFESLESRDHYLDMVHDKIVRFTLSHEVPKEKDWALFSIHGSQFDNIGIRSERWDKTSWLDAHHGGGLVGTRHSSSNRPTEDWGEFELRFAVEIEAENYEEIRDFVNTKDYSVPFTYEYKEGFSIQAGHTVKDEVKLKFEMEKNFGVVGFTSGSVKIGAEYAHSWSSSRSDTWSTQKTTTLGPINVAPGERIVIKQLVARYGPATVRGKIIIE